jgi:hypothetical protein
VAITSARDRTLNKTSSGWSGNRRPAVGRFVDVIPRRGDGALTDRLVILAHVHARLANIAQRQRHIPQIHRLRCLPNDTQGLPDGRGSSALDRIPASCAAAWRRAGRSMSGFWLCTPITKDDAQKLKAKIKQEKKIRYEVDSELAAERRGPAPLLRSHRADELTLVKFESLGVSNVREGDDDGEPPEREGRRSAGN